MTYINIIEQLENDIYGLEFLAHSSLDDWNFGKDIDGEYLYSRYLSEAKKLKGKLLKIKRSILKRYLLLRELSIQNFYNSSFCDRGDMLYENYINLSSHYEIKCKNYEGKYPFLKSVTFNNNLIPSYEDGIKELSNDKLDKIGKF